MRHGLVSLLVLCGLLAAPPAAAQAISALKAHDINRPIEWEADHSELLGREDTALFIGNVKVVQGDLTLRSDRLYVFYKLLPGSDNPEVERLDATGNVVIESSSETVEAEWGVYDIPNRLITLGDGVRLTRGETQVAGDRMELDLVSGVTKLDAGETLEGRGRVRGSFSVPGRKDDDDGDDGG